MGNELEKIEKTNKETGEIVEVTPDRSVTEIHPFQAEQQRVFTPEQIAILQAPIPDEDHDITATGMVHIPHVHLRKKLDAAFGMGNWALIPRGEPKIVNNVVYQTYALYADGLWRAEATGEQEYIPENRQMTYGSAIEGAHSNAVVRCCKHIGIGLECWDAAWREAWKAKYAVSVWVENKVRWRKAGSPRLPKETGLVSDVQKAHFEEPRALPTTGGAPSSNTITDSQKRLLFVKLGQSEYSEKELKEEFEIEHMNELPRNKMNEALTFLESKPKPKE